MKIRDLFRRNSTRPPHASNEALDALHEVRNNLKPRAQATSRERDRLIRENSWSTHIAAVYRGEA